MDVDVTAEGRMTDDGYFLAYNIMAKCPSKYDMKQRAQSGEQAPHEAIVPAGMPATRAN
jgi:cytochrome c-type biogenesis protein CcmE